MSINTPHKGDDGDDDDDDDDNNNNNKHWHDHVRNLVETSYEVEVSILWNQDVQTDRTFASNISDTIIRENGKRHMYASRFCNFRGKTRRWKVVYIVRLDDVTLKDKNTVGKF